MLKSFFRAHPIFCACAVMFVTLVPVMIMRDVSPSNELRYLSIADEAIRDGHIFTFTNQGEDYADKPPLYFWLLMLSKLVFGTHNFFILSLFSFVPAMAIIIVMDRWLSVVSSQTTLKFLPEERFAMAMMLGTSAMFAGMSVFLRMDMLMCLFIVLSLFTFYKMYKGIGNYNLQSFLLPLYIFLGLFTKGPVGILMPVVCILVYVVAMGRAKDITRYLGWRTWTILLLLCAVWFAGVLVESGPDYLKNLLFHQTVDRAIDAFHHKEPFWYYLIVVWYVVAPYSILAISSVISSAFPKGFVSDAEKLFFLSFFTTFIMLSCFSSKLSIYLAPVFPFLIYIFIFVNRREGWGKWWKFSLALPAAILIVAGIALAFLPLLMRAVPALSGLGQFDFVISPWLYPASAFLIFLPALSIYFMVSGKPWHRSVTAAALSLLLAVLSLSPLVPELNDYIGYRNLCSKAREIKVSEDMEGYATLMVSRPENMDVYLGEDIRTFGHDVYHFLGSDISDSVLIVKLSAIDAYPDLASRLSGLERGRVGEYGIFVLK